MPWKRQSCPKDEGRDARPTMRAKFFGSGACLAGSCQALADVARSCQSVAGLRADRCAGEAADRPLTFGLGRRSGDRINRRILMTAETSTYERKTRINNANRFKLGLFAMNCSCGSIATTA